MSRCFRCEKRKAKRYCPALGSFLCSLCCGLLREKEVHCFPSCPYLVQHKPYQEKKILEKRQEFPALKRPGEKEFVDDERMNWLLYHIEKPLQIIGEKDKSFGDKEAILALEYAKEKLQRERRVFLTEDELKPKNPVAEAILHSMEKCRFEKDLVLSHNLSLYKKEEKIRCLEYVISTAKFLSRADFEGRNYINNLLARFAKIREHSRQKKIITVS